MAFDVFKLRDRVVGEYKDYVESFVHIYDQRIEGFVREKLDEGQLWPDAVLQLNPAYEPGPALELAAKGELHWGTARFFGEDLRLSPPGGGDPGGGARRAGDHLDRHRLGQEPHLSGADRRPRAEEPAERHSVRALVVYPMNALINSQLEALESFSKQNWPGCRSASSTTPGRSGTRRATRSSTTRRTSCSPTT